MEKVKVIVCTGTSCHVMGADELMGIGEIIEQRFPGCVELEGASCLGLCKDTRFGRAPFVKVNERVVSEATTTRVVKEIEKVINEEQ